ncbi:monocarboxylate transporter 13-like isoform X2 [Ptychodera flava]
MCRGGTRRNRRPSGSEEENATLDGGWGWVVVMAAHFGLLLSYGSVTSFSPFVVRLKDYFGGDAGTIGGISGIALFVTLATGSTSSSLSNKFGGRVIIFIGGVVSSFGLVVTSFVTQVQYLFVTYSVISAVGYGLVVTPLMSFPALYFTKHYALANGIAQAGIAVALIVLPPLFQILIQTYGWRGAILFHSAITANICVCSALLRPPPQVRYVANDDANVPCTIRTDTDHDITDQKEENLKQKRLWMKTSYCKFLRKFFDVSFFRNPLFVLIFFDQVIISIAFFPTLLFLVARAVSYGIPQPLPATLPSVVGVSSLLGRLTHGYIIDRKIITATQGLAGGLMVCGLVNIFSSFKMNYIGLACMYSVFGIANGVYHPLTTVIIREFVGVEKFPHGQGLCNFSRGIGGILGLPIFGLIYDATNSYNACYYFSGSVFIISSFVLLTVPPCLRKCRSKQPEVSVVAK